MQDGRTFMNPGRKAATIPVVALSLILLAGTAIMAGCGKGVSLEYEPGADLALVRVESDGGLPHPGDDLFPLFQLFGDGRVVRYEGEPGGRGILVQGKLDRASIADLLQRIVDAGFFDLKDEYVDPEVYDATYRRIEVCLAEAEKTVTVWMLMDVPKFDAAYDLILGYPLGETSEYVPARGYLVVTGYPRELGGEKAFLDPNSEVYKLLPDIDTLNQAADAHTAVAVEGATFVQLKEYENRQDVRGLRISLPDKIMVLYPVYEPRGAEKPE